MADYVLVTKVIHFYNGVKLSDGAAQACHPAHLVATDAPLSPAPQIGLFAGHLQHTR